MPRHDNPTPRNRPHTLLVNSPAKTALMRVFLEQPLRRIPLPDLCRAAGVTPDRALEAIEALQREGLRIGSENAREYYFEPEESVLHPDQVAAHLCTRWWGKRLCRGEQLPSTIDAAKELASPEAHGTVVYANQQTRGRGRQGSAWVSPRGKDLLLTFLIRIPEWEPSPSLLSLFTTTAVARVLDTAYQIPVEIKWPNDLMANGKKLGGVLVERDPFNQVFLVSLGLNVHSTPADWPGEVKGLATSLVCLKRETWQRDLLLAQCGTTWETLWETLLRDRGETVRGYWRRYSSTLGKPITLNHRGRAYAGFAKNIDEHGRLLFIADTGEEMTLLAEEVQQVRVME